MYELSSGQPIKDGYERSEPKRVEAKLPHLLPDIQALVDPQAQNDSPSPQRVGAELKASGQSKTAKAHS